MPTIDKVDSKLMEELGRIAAQGRKALEVHPESPFSSGWSRDQYRHGERAAFLNDSEPTYEDLVQVDGREGDTNPFGIINERLNQSMESYPGNLCNYIWDRAEAGSSEHPGREVGYRHPHKVKTDSEKLSTFIDYGLGTSGNAPYVEQEGMQEMCSRANNLEDYFDRLTASF